jgi:hypothetical protein
MNDNFYVTLPSNVSQHKYFKQNTIANYITKLPSHISLDGKWEVGLVEVSYTKSWYNVQNDYKISFEYYEPEHMTSDSLNIKNIDLIIKKMKQKRKIK